MRLGDTRPPARRETAVPMINLALLLLIFFLIVARLAPPDPFDVTLPRTETGAVADTGDVLVIAADGRVAFETDRDAAAWTRLARRAPAGDLLVRADGALDAVTLGRVLDRLAGIGITGVSIVTVLR